MTKQIPTWSDALLNVDPQAPNIHELKQNAIAQEIDELRTRLAEVEHAFKNFHAQLCSRFNYEHDPIDWKRDQVSLIEHIAKLTTAQPADPMDWPLPCDVTVGHGTMSKGVKLRTLVVRMKALYEMATGQNADEVAGRSIPAPQGVPVRFRPRAP